MTDQLFKPDFFYHLLYYVFMFFLRALIASLVVLSSIVFLPSKIVILIGDRSFDVSLLAVLLGFIALYALLELAIYVDNWFYAKFKRDRLFSNLKKMLEAVILGDKSKAMHSFAVVKKMVGIENDVTRWFDGYLLYSVGNLHDAKARFYELTRANDDVLGCYTLFHIGKRENDTQLQYDILKKLSDNKKNMPNSMLIELAKLEILNKNFETARGIAKRAKNQRLIAISYFLENPNSLESLKNAYSLCKILPAITIAYAKQYLESYDDKRTASKILLKAWRNLPVPDLFLCYAEINNDAKALKKLFCEQFVFYNEFAKFALSKELYGLAYEYFLKAFTILKSRAVFDSITNLHKIDEKFQVPSCYDFANDFNWVCAKCQFIATSWDVQCPCCSDIDSYKWTNNFVINNAVNSGLYLI